MLTQTGTFAAGDMGIALPLGIVTMPLPAPTPPAEYGPDHLACTPDDVTAAAAAVTVLLSTGTNSIILYDAGNERHCQGGSSEGHGLHQRRQLSGRHLLAQQVRAEQSAVVRHQCRLSAG